MDPLTVAKFSVYRIAGEFGAWVGTSALALTVTETEVGIAISILLAVVGAIVWLVRLEGRVNLLTSLIDRMDKRTGKIADHLGVIE